MSDATTVNNTSTADTSAETVKQTTTVEPTPVEQEALDQGWMPKDKWEAEGKSVDEWKPAAEFVRTGELYKTIHQTKRELKQTQATLTALQRHHQYVFDKAHQQAIADLKREKRQALKSEELDRVEEIDEQIEETQATYQKEKTELVQQQQTAAASVPPPEFESWKVSNTWYDRDTDMRELADAQGLIYLSKNPKASADEVLKFVDARIRKYFPDKFGARRTAPNPTASVDKTSGKGASKDEDVAMDDAQREIMRTFVRQGVMTEAQYRAELKKVSNR